MFKLFCSVCKVTDAQLGNFSSLSPVPFFIPSFPLHFYIAKFIGKEKCGHSSLLALQQFRVLVKYFMLCEKMNKYLSVQTMYFLIGSPSFMMIPF